MMLTDDDDVAADDGVIELALQLAGRGTFRAVVGGMPVTGLTDAPLYDGARALLALGYSPATAVRVRRAGAVVLTGVIGKLAKWTLDAAGKKRPFEAADVR